MPTSNNIANELYAWCCQQSPLLDMTAHLSAANGSFVMQALRVEASHRQFHRLLEPTSARSWVAMWSPPELENNEQFVALAETFAGIGTPALLAADLSRGFFLMEDLGSLHLADAYLAAKTSAQIQHIVDRALAALFALQKVSAATVPDYSAERLMMEFDLCARWFGQELMQLGLSKGEQDTLSNARQTLVEAMLEQPQVCVHRDYHCRNLLWSEAPNGDAQIGMVDFQDALMGPALYDPASLLQDCYYRHDKALITNALQTFASHHPTLAAYPDAKIQWWHDACAIQRQIKAVGIFARLYLRDSKSSHLRYIPAVLQRAAALAASYPDLSSLSMRLASWAEEAKNHALLTSHSERAQ